MIKITFIITLLSLSFSVFAESDRPWWRLSGAVAESTGVAERLFTSEEQRILRDYLKAQREDEDDDNDRDYKHKDKKYKKDKKHKNDKHYKGKKQKPLPPGLQKKVDRGGQLPPGWQKKVAKGEVLDADMYEVSDDLPPGILRQLENIEGTSVRQVEDRVVRILDSTGEILDVLLGR